MAIYGIIGAMDSEVQNLIARMTDTRPVEVAGRLFTQGKLAGQHVVVVKSGIGKVAAAITAQMLVDRFGVTALINTGMAGGLDTRLAVKDLVVATGAVQHDFDLTAFGHAPGYMHGEDDSRPTVFEADKALCHLALAAAEQVLPAGSKAITGTIASGDIFVDDSDLKAHIIRQFDAAATEMEGAAIAQTACANGVPFAILRVISDLAEHQANVSFDELEVYAGQLAGDITVAMLKA
ncbi:MAG: 5'-methylthioadenosine/adenosylhomocysteine nucleosidase [Ruminococcaceae bacterium]|nr:5'-methylthioadenosine/adenosylhomocysteine nucleosidase [Oscillospiraceae bacterium]